MRCSLDLDDRMVADIDEETAKIREKYEGMLSRLGTIRILLREALAMRRKAPDAKEEVTNLRLEYEEDLVKRKPPSVPNPDREMKVDVDSIVVVERQSQDCEIYPGMKMSFGVLETVRGIRELGGIAHKKQLVKHLAMPENVVGQRLKHGLMSKVINRVERGIYTTRMVEDGELQLTKEEMKLLIRARSFSLIAVVKQP